MEALCKVNHIMVIPFANYHHVKDSRLLVTSQRADFRKKQNKKKTTRGSKHPLESRSSEAQASLISANWNPRRSRTTISAELGTFNFAGNVPAALTSRQLCSSQQHKNTES